MLHIGECRADFRLRNRRSSNIGGSRSLVIRVSLWEAGQVPPFHGVDVMEKDAATSGRRPLLRPRSARKQPMVGRPPGQTCRWIPDLLRTAGESGGLHAKRRGIPQHQPTCSRHSVKRCVALSCLRRPKPQPRNETQIHKLVRCINRNASLSQLVQASRAHASADPHEATGLGLQGREPRRMPARKVAQMLCVRLRNVHCSVPHKRLRTKASRIAEDPFCSLLDHSPTRARPVLHRTRSVDE
jgi:hypothetical protein